MSINWPQRKAAEFVTLQASAPQTATGNSAAGTAFPIKVDCIVWELNLTTAAAGHGDLLDVYVQTMIDGATWVDIVHFTQAFGDGGAKRYFAKTVAELSETIFENATTLAAGSVRNLFGDQYRAR